MRRALRSLSYRPLTHSPVLAARLVGGMLAASAVLAMATPTAAAAVAIPQPAGHPLAGLDAYVESAMAAWDIPGFALAVVQGDSILYTRGYGTTARGPGGTPVTPNTLFAIASTSKAFTTAAIAMLVDEGRLAWDDKVTDHLPDFALSDPWVTRELTVRDLVTHRVGVARLDNLWIASPFDRAEILRRARHLPQVDGFRSTYGYNNILYIVAGELVAALTGQSWDDVMEDRLFGPLGMTRSTSRTAVVEARPDVAEPHTRVDEVVRVIPRRDYDAIGGAGAIWSSATDMAQWIRLHLNDGAFEGATLISAGQMAEMQRPVTVMPIDSTARRMHPTNHFSAYALGWRVQDLHGRRLVHHSGSINYTRTHVAIVPEEGIGVVAMANLSSSNLQLAITHWILDALQGRTPEDWSAQYLELDARSASASARSAEALAAARIPDAPPALPLAAYTGDFEDALFGDLRITEEGGRLVLHYSPEYIADLEPWHQDMFRATWRRPGAGTTFVTFHLDTRGRVRSAAVDGFATFTR
jgi:CubicO group peptidase (beta-lactamase class C family)